jgi:shikimate kinase
MISYGAVSVVNAIPCGIGATVGIDLTTVAEFSIRRTRRTVSIVNDRNESTDMAKICVKNVFKHFGIEEPEGWSLSVDSQIPISRGLKSSSSACNAIVSAVAGVISKEYGKGFGTSKEDVLDMIRLGVECAKEARVTVTGAFDDACGCHLGGFVITDNEKNELIGHRGIEQNDAILLIPEARIRKPSLDTERLRRMSDAARDIVKIAEKDWYTALTMNGRLVADAVGIDDGVAKKAISMGALAAGVSGTGPAISVIVGKNEGRSFLKDLEHDGYDVIVTRTR